jgi:hypothetical protein
MIASFPHVDEGVVVAMARRRGRRRRSSRAIARSIVGYAKGFHRAHGAYAGQSLPSADELLASHLDGGVIDASSLGIEL